MTGEYCGQCGQELQSVGESDTCVGCGRPAREVATRDPTVRGHGKRWQSRARLFGLPLVDVALGPYGDERVGKARGIVAIGDTATGLFACGGIAIGIIAAGGLSLGIVSLGGLALGLLALGGAAVGGAVAGGLAVGAIALGGAAIGYVVQGGGAVGFYARGGGAVGAHVASAAKGDPVATRFFADWSWLLGSGPAQAQTFVIWLVAAMLAVTLCCAVIIPVAYVVRPRHHEYR